MISAVKNNINRATSKWSWSCHPEELPYPSDFSNIDMVFFFKILFIYLERGKEREKERERKISVRETQQLVASHTPPGGEPGSQPTHVP